MQSGDQCTVCNQRLNKTLDDLDAADKVIAAKDNELVAVRDQMRLMKEQIDLQKAMDKLKDEKIKLLEKQNRKSISFLFGVVKIKF